MAILSAVWLTWCVTCKVYWNSHVPHLRAQHKMMQSQISYQIFIVNRYYPFIHRVHKLFPLNLICLKLRWYCWDWTNLNNCNTVTDGPFAMQICWRCMVNHKKKNPYWSTGIAASSEDVATSSTDIGTLNGECLSVSRVFLDVLLAVHYVLHVSHLTMFYRCFMMFYECFTMFNNVLRCSVSRTTIGMGTCPLQSPHRQPSSAAGISDNTTKVIPC